MYTLRNLKNRKKMHLYDPNTTKNTLKSFFKNVSINRLMFSSTQILRTGFSEDWHACFDLVRKLNEKKMVGFIVVGVLYNWCCWQCISELWQAVHKGNYAHMLVNGFNVDNIL